MIKRKIKKQLASELRMDLVSNDWVAIAAGRARRPSSFGRVRRRRKETAKKDCPFCQSGILEGGVRARRDQTNGDWLVVAVPNQYPAFSPAEELNQRKKGPNQAMDGVGYHEIIITFDHEKQMAQFSREEIKAVIEVYQERYLDLMKKKFVKYVSIFHNHGPEAGASVSHPHSQIIAIPVLDPDLRNSIDGANNYFQSQGKCVYCAMLNWDIRDKKRIIYENEKFVVLCPFAPQVSFEVRVYPKKHQPYFEKIDDKEKDLFADALRQALSRIYKGLKNPDYNFYIHTAPCDGANYDFYHWHLNIIPKTSVWAGFELCAGIEISTIEPEKAARYLRKQ